MGAVVRTESGFHPWRIGVNDGAPLRREPASLSEAKAVARALLAQGRNLDLGLAQINSANLSRLGLTIDTVFEPCHNIHAAAVVLRGCYARARRRYGDGQPALQAALSCYNTNSLFRGFANGYVQKVVDSSSAYVPAIDPHHPVPVAPASSSRRSGARGPSGAPAGTAPGPHHSVYPKFERVHGVLVIRGLTGG
jgi:type IV secretion system protein VirB1